MHLAIVGLGKMGANMARRLSINSHTVVGYNRSKEIIDQLSGENIIIPAYSIGEVVNKLSKPRIIWLMVPAGDATEDNLIKIADLLSEGDIIIDGANSNFNDTVRRAKYLSDKNINFVDVGVSGGIWGLQEGYSLMIGGEKNVVDHLEPILSSLAPGKDKGWGHVGPNGAGHFVKMVHNGIEYGMMESYAEGFELLKEVKNFDLDLHKISKIWEDGSVVRSWLLELISRALEEDQSLTNIKDWVADSGEGRWTVIESINNDVPTPVIAFSLFRRFYSRQDESYSAKLLAAMRNQFGGHEVKEK